MGSVGCFNVFESSFKILLQLKWTVFYFNLFDIFIYFKIMMI